MPKGVCLASAALLILGACDTLVTAYGGMGSRLPYRESIDMKVGESAVLHHAAASCDAKEPPSWEAVEEAFLFDPEGLGVFSDAGARWSYIEGCDEPVHARGVRFTALRPGDETLLLFGDPVAVTVIPRDTGATYSAPTPPPRPPA